MDGSIPINKVINILGGENIERCTPKNLKSGIIIKRLFVRAEWVESRKRNPVCEKPQAGSGIWDTAESLEVMSVGTENVLCRRIPPKGEADITSDKDKREKIPIEKVVAKRKRPSDQNLGRGFNIYFISRADGDG
jgi:hypothetical protein